MTREELMDLLGTMIFLGALGLLGLLILSM